MFTTFAIILSIVIVTHFVNFKHNFHKEIKTFFKNKLKWIKQGLQGQGVCLTVARSPVASAYRLGLVERPSPLARRASDHDIRFLQ